MVKPPYKNCWNGISRKIEGNETEIQTTIRKGYEENSIELDNPKLFITFYIHLN